MNTPSNESQFEDELKYISLSEIHVNPFQPRKEFKSEDIEELAQSILAVGLLHPLVVRPLPESNSYELISGERRYRAAKLAGISVLPVFVRKITYSISAKAALIENIQRVDLNPLEIAKALKRLMIEFSYTQEDLSQQIGKKRSTLANYLRLLTLPEAIQTSLSKGLISMGHSKAILALNQIDKQNLLHEIILRDNLSVRQAEKFASRLGTKNRRQTPIHHTKDDNLGQLVNVMREKLGTKVSIQAKGKQGKIQIEYYGIDDLERLLLLLGISMDE